MAKKKNNTLLLAGGAAFLLLILAKNKGKATTNTDTNTNTPDTQPTFASPTDYVNKMWKYASQTQAETNIPAPAMIIISAIETGWGKFPNSVLGKYNNYFGIEADSSWTGPVSTPNDAGQNFRAYNTIQDSFNDFADFITSNSLYANAISDESDTIKFITDIINDGYAGSDATTQSKYIATATQIYNSMNAQFTSLNASS